MEFVTIKNTKCSNLINFQIVLFKIFCFYVPFHYMHFHTIKSWYNIHDLCHVILYFACIRGLLSKFKASEIEQLNWHQATSINQMKIKITFVLYLSTFQLIHIKLIINPPKIQSVKRFKWCFTIDMYGTDHWIHLE